MYDRIMTKAPRAPRAQTLNCVLVHETPEGQQSVQWGHRPTCLIWNNNQSTNC